MSKRHVKTDDMVKVIAGNDKGKTGKVLKVFRKEGKAVVENINFRKKHKRENPQQDIKGGILEREAPVDISNLQVICPECDDTTRSATKVLEDGRKVRICKKCEGVIDR